MQKNHFSRRKLIISNRLSLTLFQNYFVPSQCLGEFKEGEIMRHAFCVIAWILGVFFVSWLHAANTGSFAVNDVHTQSNFNYVPVKHMSMNLTLDMNNKKFSGYVDLRIENPVKQEQLVVDTKHLNIISASISAKGTQEDWQSTNFKLGEYEEVRGQSLSVDIDDDTVMVRVAYETTSKSTGLDWVDAKLTASGFPMMATQFQAINARTFVPCQDTPAQKITYDAHMTLKSDVTDPNMRIVMAAMERTSFGNGRYHFKMTNPIPTYLIALAAGVFEEIPISDRVSVIAEPQTAKAAAEEFADAEKMVQTAELLFGSYAWKRFDIFIMPPSFSYGGMENPTMTFIGPTVVAGDKSLVDVIAHELSHSWAGNYVTNENWDDFWINEGTTMYLERLIIRQLYGKDLRDIDIVLGQKILEDNINLIMGPERKGAPLTRLKLELSHDFDPDDAVSHVPYEKGFNFWLALEQAYGQDQVLGFLKQYFKDHAFGTMTSSKLKKLITSYGPFDGATKVDIDNWFYGEGLPNGGLPKVESAHIRDAEEASVSFNDSGIHSMEDLASKFNTKQWPYFLRLQKSLPLEKLKSLEKTYGLTKKNDEVKYNFFALVVRSGAYKAFEQEIDGYLGRVGRIKYIGPIYEALRDNKQKDIANSLYNKHKSHNNHITNGSIARKLGIQSL